MSPGGSGAVASSKPIWQPSTSSVASWSVPPLSATMLSALPQTSAQPASWTAYALCSARLSRSGAAQYPWPSSTSRLPTSSPSRAAAKAKIGASENRDQHRLRSRSYLRHPDDDPVPWNPLVQFAYFSLFGGTRKLEEHDSYARQDAGHRCDLPPAPAAISGPLL